MIASPREDRSRSPSRAHGPKVLILVDMVFGFQGWTAVPWFRSAAIKAPRLPMVGLLVAMVGLVLAQVLHMPVLDGVASVLIGLVLARTAAFLARETKGLLLGEAASPRVRASLREITATAPGVSGVNEILTMHFGPAEVLAAISLDFDDSPSAAEVERTATGLERRIKQAYPEIRRIFVEAQSREGRFQAGSGGLRRPGHSRGQRRLHARAP